ncbi:MAG: hypothetical protein KKD07_01880 [Candidatus Omnitrophica bacterium]|nr:hypothetical protein [Candidatus Omnitrophota bacterium]MBU1997031.1 hypothetical protein [Candidatus Omnitrophota bacterium]MBU4333170.1 hypothetical protein [Candidatus Omnitrophota bacterium]
MTGKKKKITFILFIVAFLVGGGSMYVKHLEKTMGSYRLMRNIETAVSKVKPNINLRSNQESKHLVNFITPVFSIGIF